MEISKDGTAIASAEVDTQSAGAIDHNGSTALDTRDMARMGKRQELRRNFRFFSIVCFVMILQSTWESSLLASYYGLLNGGTAGTIWMSTAVWLCVVAMIASMAEMASMAPTSGGQYHWVSEFAPDTYQGPLSYIVGWCCCLGWVSGIPACGQLLSGMVQSMILLVNPNADIAGLWQTTLLIFAFMALAFAFNLFLAKYLPLAEGTVMVLHLAGFIIFLVIFWAMGKHPSAEQVFTQTYNGGGWSNIGLSTFVGISSPLWYFIGPDAGAHMSEELQDASIQLPRAMMFATFFNGVLGLTMLITYCFCIPDVSAVVDSASTYPVLDVIHNVTGSLAATCVLGSILVIVAFMSTITVIASASRQAWAFARDGGFPYSKWIAYVRPGWDIPVNAILMCAAVSYILAAINFGSDVALNAIISVSNAALVFSYLVSISCIRLKRLRGEPLLPRKFNLGRLGGPLNDITLIFLVISFIFSFFPVAPLTGDPTWAQDMNWAIVLFAATVILSGAHYWSGGRHTYVPPVRLVKQE